MNVLVLLLPFALASSDCGAVLIIKNPCCSLRKTWGFGGKHRVGVAIFRGIPGWWTALCSKNKQVDSCVLSCWCFEMGLRRLLQENCD